MQILQADDSKSIRWILAWLVDNRDVASRVASQWRGSGLFPSDQANLIGGWAMQHVIAYHEPLRASGLMQELQRWLEPRGPQDALGASVERLAGHLLQELPQLVQGSAEYALDRIAEYFNTTALQEQLQQASEDLRGGRLDAVYGRLQKLSQIELGNQGDLFDPTVRQELLQDAFTAEENEPLVSYGGALGELLDKAMLRDSLLAVMASDKMGKSMFLVDLTIRALQARRRVAYFECGDMGRRQMLQRMGQRLTGLPRREQEVRVYDESQEWTECDDPPTRVELRSELTAGTMLRRLQRLAYGGVDLLRVGVFAAGTLSVAAIHQKLDRLAQREDWVPDVVLVDYADILAPPAGVRDTLDQIDENWKQLRRLSQDWHALVMTATQANADAYGSDRAPGRKNFSGRKTKLAHVVGMLGLSRKQTDFDKGLSRLGWVVGRNWEWREGRTIPVFGCWEISHPFMVGHREQEFDTRLSGGIVKRHDFFGSRNGG